MSIHCSQLLHERTVLMVCQQKRALWSLSQVSSKQNGNVIRRRKCPEDNNLSRLVYVLFDILLLKHSMNGLLVGLYVCEVLIKREMTKKEDFITTSFLFAFVFIMEASNSFLCSGRLLRCRFFTRTSFPLYSLPSSPLNQVKDSALYIFPRASLAIWQTHIYDPKTRNWPLSVQASNGGPTHLFLIIP
jgi:hypothetical protein